MSRFAWYLLRCAARQCLGCFLVLWAAIRLHDSDRDFHALDARQCHNRRSIVVCAVVLFASVRWSSENKRKVSSCSTMARNSRVFRLYSAKLTLNVCYANRDCFVEVSTCGKASQSVAIELRETGLLQLKLD